MDKLKVFSEKLGAAITMNDELAACGVDSYSWSNSGWNNYSYGWSNSGWSNSGGK